MIREKFPEKRFPHFSLQEISAELYQRLAPLVPEFLQVSFKKLIINVFSIVQCKVWLLNTICTTHISMYVICL